MNATTETTATAAKKTVRFYSASGTVLPLVVGAEVLTTLNGFKYSAEASYEVISFHIAAQTALFGHSQAKFTPADAKALATKLRAEGYNVVISPELAVRKAQIVKGKLIENPFQRKF